MLNATRIAVAAAAFSALAVVACTANPDETPSVEVQQGNVDPKCIRGGLTCGVLGTTSGSTATTTSGGVYDPGTSTSSSSGTSGKLSSGYVSSSGFLDPGTSSGSTTPPLNPPKGVDPINCGDACVPKYDTDGTIQACDCHGGGNGLQSGIVCPVTAPCRYMIYGYYRCFGYDPNGTCH